MSAGRLATTLRWSWWLVMPAFAVLVVRLDVERMCARPYELLPAATTQPSIAWALSTLYVAAHAWIAAAWLATALHADAILPSWQRARELWDGRAWLLWTTAAIFVLEYWPIPIWRALGRAIPGCGA